MDLQSAQISIILIVLTVTVSVAGFTNSRLLDGALLDIHRITRNREFYRLLTSGLVHADVMHLFINMLTLLFFGPPVEHMVGGPAFLILYVACLLAGSGWSLLENLRRQNYRALGASGAISGVTVCFALFFPLAQINLFFVAPMPAILFAVLYLAWSIFATGRFNDGIGHAAHLGGGLMGLVFTCLFWPGQIEELYAQLRSLIPN